MVEEAVQKNWIGKSGLPQNGNKMRIESTWLRKINAEDGCSVANNIYNFKKEYYSLQLISIGQWNSS